MKVLLLGIGMQGKAALYDLVNSQAVHEVIAADKDLDLLKTYVKSKQINSKVRCEYIDANNTDSIQSLMTEELDVVIDLLPVTFVNNIATAAVDHGIHLINTVSVTSQMKELATEAKLKNITILPEFGLDPGIDLVLLGEAVRKFDKVTSIKCYGAGLPEPEAADNPIRYKVTWTFEGVLQTYLRGGRIIQDGKTKQIKATDIFHPTNVHELEIKGLGKLEAFPNGDALGYLEPLGLIGTDLQHMGRYTLRYPGHVSFWKKMVDLHLLDDEPVIINGVEVDRKRFLAAVIEPHIKLEEDERDLALVRIEVIGRINGQKKRITYQVIDKKDLKTGLTGMNRTVGFTASIGAQLIGTNAITQRGLLSPVKDIPYEIFKEELTKRGILIEKINE
ncbi:MAG: saccharopine dehydrogenase family protein [Candidatus Hodarchaeota archaeon]